MQLFCQKCQAAFASSTHCPRCSSRLLSPQESFIHAGKSRKPLPDPIASTFTNRLIIGSMIAFGLALGLREFAAAFMSLNGHNSNEWQESNTDPKTFAIRLFAVLGGGLIAGAGRRQGMQVGAATGLIVGGLFTIFDFFLTGLNPNFTLIFLAAVYPLMSCIAGAVGAWLWPADVELPEPARLSSHGSSLARLAADDAESRIARPTAWIRISIAAVFVAVVIISSDSIRLMLAKVSGGAFNIGGVARSTTIGLEIGTLCALIGGMFAGASTGAGLKHGLLASVLTGLCLLLVAGQQPDGLFPATKGYLNLFGFENAPLRTPRIAIHFQMGLTAIMSLAGALGGQLFPPLMPKKMWSRSLQRQS